MNKRNLIIAASALLVLVLGLGGYLLRPSTPHYHFASPALGLSPSQRRLATTLHASGTLIDPLAQQGNTLSVHQGQYLYLVHQSPINMLGGSVQSQRIISTGIYEPAGQPAPLPVLIPGALGATKVTFTDGAKSATFTVVVLPALHLTKATNPDLTTAPSSLDPATSNGQTLTYHENSAVLVAPVGTTQVYTINSSNPNVAVGYYYEHDNTLTPALRILKPGTTQISVSWDAKVSHFSIKVTA